MTEALKEKVAGTAEDGGFVVCGHGVNIVKVAKVAFTTAIKKVAVNSLKNDNCYYDLQGRKVAEPTKGLYIINGKKVMIK